MRVNNARNSWKIDHAQAATMRTFYDGSLWESRKLQGPDALMRLVREGVQQTSAVCVLIGTHTWSRRWVRYEIARAVIDNRGLLAVHLNNINHHQQPYLPHALGQNPLNHLGVYKLQPNALGTARYYLYKNTGSGWFPYDDYTDPVTLPPYLADLQPGWIMPLSNGAAVYDFKHGEGHKNLGAWIDHAAQAVGR